MDSESTYEEGMGWDGVMEVSTFKSHKKGKKKSYVIIMTVIISIIIIIIE